MCIPHPQFRGITTRLVYWEETQRGDRAIFFKFTVQDFFLLSSRSRLSTLRYFFFSQRTCVFRGELGRTRTLLEVASYSGSCRGLAVSAADVGGVDSVDDFGDIEDGVVGVAEPELSTLPTNVLVLPTSKKPAVAFWTVATPTVATPTLENKLANRRNIGENKNMFEQRHVSVLQQSWRKSSTSSRKGLNRSGYALDFLR